MFKMRFPGSAVFGIILIAIGTISLLSGLGYVDSWDIFSTYWPLVVMLLGVKHMIDYKSSTTFGLILFVVGGLFMVDNLDYEILDQMDVYDMIIPIIIILIGLQFLLPKRKEEDEISVDVKKMKAEIKSEVKEAKTKVKEEVNRAKEEVDRAKEKVMTEAGELKEKVKEKVSGTYPSAETEVVAEEDIEIES